jgi:hypothetical protein
LSLALPRHQPSHEPPRHPQPRSALIRVLSQPAPLLASSAPRTSPFVARMAAAKHRIAAIV